MGKVVICTNESDMRDICAFFGGFKENIKMNVKQEFDLAVYNKLRIDVENYMSVNGDFVAMTGTPIYKGKMGKHAMNSVLREYDGDIDHLRSEFAGSYCVVLYVEGKLKLFVDPAATYAIYYYIGENGRVLITNTFYHIAKVVKDNVDIEKLFDYSVMKSIGRDSTPFENIFKLEGNQYLSYEDGIWRICNVEKKCEKIQKDIAGEAKQIYSFLPELFQKSTVFMTGGQDSRLSLALLLNMGMSPSLSYGIGDASDTATKKEDKSIVDAIGDKCGLDVRYMNWSNSINNREDIINYLHRYGELFDLYSLNKNFLNEFEAKIDTDLIVFGYYGEIYRTIEDIENYNKDEFSLLEYVNDLYVAEKKELLKKPYQSGFVKRIVAQQERICKECELSSQILTKNDFQCLNTYVRETWSARCNNLANLFFYSIPLFGDKRLTRIAEKRTFNERLNSKIQIECIKALEDKLVEIPFFSHVKKKHYDPSTGELTDKQVISRIKDIIRKNIKSVRMLRLARGVYYILRRDTKGYRETEKEMVEREILIKQLKETKLGEIIDFDVAKLKLEARTIKGFLLKSIMVEDVK